MAAQANHKLQHGGGEEFEADFFWVYDMVLYLGIVGIIVYV